MSKTQRWEWAVSLKIEELNDGHLQMAYKLNWDNLCKFDSCRKNCKRVLCLACFDRSWLDNDNTSNSYFGYETSNCEQKRTDLKAFVGLKNLGATCYVNCLLQLWFHNPALRKAIYEWDKNDNAVDVPNKNAGSQKMIEDARKDNDISSPLKRPREEDQSSASPSPKKSTIKSLDKNDNKKVEIVSTNNSSNLSQQKKSQDKTIEQLQLIFARMQFTNKKSIDPFNFIDSLNLNAAEQQDAQEFGNLFMELMERKFADQKNTFVSKIIPKQFRGRYSYATICDHCKHSSLSESTFYELDLSIQNHETLHNSLNSYFKPVPLDGKYNCSQCKQARSAHRKIILKSLPPTLNLQLLRFVYDVQKNVRQKLNSYIIFPEILDMNPYFKDSTRPRGTSFDNLYLINGSPTMKPQSEKSNIYILSAVLIHRGSSPHSGHYIAHIKDRVSKDWYKFNDDSVEKIGPQLQVSSDGESITIVEDKTEIIKTSQSNGGKLARLESKSLKSKTAYMLVYQAQDNEALSYPSDHSEGWRLPDHLQMAVAEENSRSEEIFESLEIAKEVDQQHLAIRKSIVRQIYEQLICRDPKEKFEFIDKNWLQNWLTNSSSTAKFNAIDNSHLLCYHRKLDFRKIDQVKCIRSEGANMLYDEYGGGPRLVDAMCRDCVELEVQLIQLKEKLKENQKFITSQSKFKIEAGYDFNDAYIVGKKSYRDWQALVMCQFEKLHPELLNRKKSSGGAGQNVSSDEDDSNKDKDKSDSNEKNNHTNNNEDNNSDSESDDEALERFVFNSDILCDHNQLIHETTAWRIVPKEVWEIFKGYFGNDPERPLIEYNANTLMCAECKRQEDKQQEIGDIQKAIAFEQKTRLPDLFHNRKRASWCSMQPTDEYYALDRQFLTKWQKFLRNPTNQEKPDAVKHKDKIICEHGKSLYNAVNTNPLLPECPFTLISATELSDLKDFYPVDQTIKFRVDPELADKTLKAHIAKLKATTASKKSHPLTENAITSTNTSAKILDESGDRDAMNKAPPYMIDLTLNDDTPTPVTEELDLTEIDWSECIVSDPGFCSDCHEMLKQDELKRLLNYDSATIYITKVENIAGCHGTPSHISSSSNGATAITNNDNCDNSETKADPSKRTSELNNPNTATDDGDDHPFKRRRKIYTEDEANDFVPPGATKQVTLSSPASSSILRRTTRRNRNREQAYTIKPNQTLLELKKEIYNRWQVFVSDQRLFLNDVILDDNSKTMAELRIVPNCSLKLEVSILLSDSFDCHRCTCWCDHEVRKFDELLIHKHTSTRPISRLTSQ